MKRGRCFKLFQLAFVLVCDARTWVPITPTTVPSATAALRTLHLPRGGSIHELNRDYRSSPSRRRDAKRGQVRRVIEESMQQGPSHHLFERQGPSWSSDPKKRASTKSPTVTAGSIACILVWLLWQLPAPRAHLWLLLNFVCSREHVRHGLLHTTLLSAFSHASFTHLFFNLLVFRSFGPSVARTLSTRKWPLWPFVIGSAVFTSYVRTALSGNGGMGLSGVTLALFAFDSRCEPESTMCIFLFGVFPIRMKARKMLFFAFAYEVVRMLVASLIKTNIAHSAHIAGLVFGIGYYELWMHRYALKRFCRRLRLFGRNVRKLLLESTGV